MSTNSPIHLIIHTDGGSRGNPGQAAIGAVIEQNGQVIKRISEYIGIATNNLAEYRAVYAALTFAHAHGVNSVDVYADSELVVRQLTGEYKIKNRDLGEWFIRIQSVCLKIGRVTFTPIPRERNSAADELVNRALDEQAAIHT